MGGTTRRFVGRGEEGWMERGEEGGDGEREREGGDGSVNDMMIRLVGGWGGRRNEKTRKERKKLSEWEAQKKSEKKKEKEKKKKGGGGKKKKQLWVIEGRCVFLWRLAAVVAVAAAVECGNVI